MRKVYPLVTLLLVFVFSSLASAVKPGSCRYPSYTMAASRFLSGRTMVGRIVKRRCGHCCSWDSGHEPGSRPKASELNTENQQQR